MGLGLVTSSLAAVPDRAPAPPPALAAAAADSSRPPSGGGPAPAPQPTHVAPPDARIYLTWHAPYGQPGATDQLVAACGDTSSKDTLYMCFDPGRDAPAFLGFQTTVYFWAATGEPLGEHWKFGEGPDYHGLEVQITPDSVPGVEPARLPSQFHFSGYSSTPSSGKLLMIAADAADQGQPVKARRLYAAARVLVPRPALKTSGCDRPICIEWSIAELGYALGDDAWVNRGPRFVSWNSPGGKICAPLRQFAAPPPWRPPPVKLPQR